MQEEIITKRFTLDQGTTLKAATAAVMSNVFSALKAEGQLDSEATFSGTGQMAVNEQSGFPVFQIHASGVLKAHETGDFSTQITLKKGAGLGLTKIFGIMHAVNVFGLPIITGALCLVLFRGSIIAALIGAGLGFLVGILIATSFSKAPAKSLANAKRAVESKLSGIEFTSAP
jgi:hypothetical protein